MLAPVGQTRIYFLLFCVFEMIGACAPTVLKDTPAPSMSDIRRKCTLGTTCVVGRISYADGSPASQAYITATNVDTGLQTLAVASDASGRYQLPVAQGDYAIAITSHDGVLLTHKQTIGAGEQNFTLTTKCNRISGTIPHASSVEDITFALHSFDVGDVFVAESNRSGRFQLCLPAGEYSASISGEMLSTPMKISVPMNQELLILGYPDRLVKSTTDKLPTLPSSIDALVADIRSSKARLIGLGEATHGSAEFVSTREQLTFELARKADLRLVLLESDAVSVYALQRYVNGESADVEKLVAALGFWVTDTREFIAFIEHVRAYNSAQPGLERHIRIWGVDAQDTEPAVRALIGAADRLGLSKIDGDLLQALVAKRGKGVLQFAPEQRERLDGILSRLAAPLTSSEDDLLLAVAARSLALQLGYLQGDIRAMYEERRDAATTQLATFILQATGVPRACLWAHVDHVARYAKDGLSVGQRLSLAFKGSYYPVGFYLLRGTSRAWDPAGKIGVISYSLGNPPPFSAEAALMKAAGMPTVAWVPFKRLPRAWDEWLDIPRFVRELGAVYLGEEHVTLLVDLKFAFDGMVVIRDVHDSSPTATGVRRADDSSH